VLLRDPQSQHRTFARVKVPKEMLPRFVEVDARRRTFVPLEEVIADNLDALFPGMEILDHGVFRVTRDADLEISDEADDLLQAVEAELRRRRFGEAVRVELAPGMSEALRGQIVEALNVEDRQVYEVEGLLDAGDLMQLATLQGFGELRDPPVDAGSRSRALQGEEREAGDIMGAMREGDILVHHPYDSFSTSVERFVARRCPIPTSWRSSSRSNRTSNDTPLVPNLIARPSAASRRSASWSSRRASTSRRTSSGPARSSSPACTSSYGHPSLKTHAKCVLVIRREGDGVRHYVHVGHRQLPPEDARLYTDFGLFTCDEELGADVADMFNFLTGFGRPRGYRKALGRADAPARRDPARDRETIQAHERGSLRGSR
jgi:polyphosphate kinase